MNVQPIECKTATTGNQGADVRSGAERMVLINQLPLGLEDLKYIIPYD